MRSNLYKFAGVFLIGAGAYDLYKGYESADPATSAIGWAAIIIGALATLAGFSLSKRKNVPESGSKADQKQNVEFNLLIMSMGVTARADSKIRNVEIETITKICRQLLDTRVSEEVVKATLSELDQTPRPLEYLTLNRDRISDEMRRTIIRSCHLIMLSDLEIPPAEEKVIYEIAAALGLSQQETKDILASTAT